MTTLYVHSDSEVFYHLEDSNGVDQYFIRFLPHSITLKPQGGAPHSNTYCPVEFDLKDEPLPMGLFVVVSYWTEKCVGGAVEHGNGRIEGVFRTLEEANAMRRKYVDLHFCLTTRVMLVPLLP